MPIIKRTTTKKTSIKEAANAKPKVEVKPVEKKAAAPAKKPAVKVEDNKPKILSLKDINFADFKANK